MLNATFTVYAADGRSLGDATVPVTARPGDNGTSHIYPNEPVTVPLTQSGVPSYAKVRFLEAVARISLDIAGTDSLALAFATTATISWNGGPCLTLTPSDK